MSRSRRRTQRFGNTTAASDKPFKKQEHSRARSRVKQAIRKGKTPPDQKAFGNPWGAPKDGKRYWRKATAKDMRK